MATADEDPIDEIWKDDLLERREDAEFLIHFLATKSKEGTETGKRSYVLNIDAGWGHGKTFFLSRLRNTIEISGYPVAYVNAWYDDHADDPLLPVMAAIDTAVRAKPGVQAATKRSLGKLAIIGGRVAVAAGKGILQQATQKYVGQEAVNAIKDLAGDAVGSAAKSASTEAGKKLGELYDASGKALIDKFERGKRSIEDFKRQLADVLSGLEEGGRPLFVLVDELDRCRPTYAVALLERIKHLFEIDDVVFLLATDTDQLRHSISGMYGAQFDANRYLHRFFDQTYKFEEPKRKPLVELLLREINVERIAAPHDASPAEFIGQAFDAMQLGLRDLEQCLHILGNCVTAWQNRARIELAVILPLIIAQQRRVTPSFSGSFKAELDQQLGTKNWSNVRVIFRANRSADPPKAYDGWQVFDQFVGIANTRSLLNLPELDGGTSPLVRWVVQVFQNERQLRFFRGIDVRSQPSSVILDYPKLVRSVGRLTPADSEQVRA